MNVKGIIVQQIDWDGTSKSLTMQPDNRLGDLWVAFPTDYEEPRTGPFYFQNPNYEKRFNSNIAECKARKLATDNFYEMNGAFHFRTVWENILTEQEALTYYALYLPEYAVPLRVNLFDPININNKFKRTVIKDNQNPRYIIYLKCSSQIGSFNFNLECSFKKDKNGFDESSYTDEYQTTLYSNPEEWQYLMNQHDKENVQKFFADQIIINNGKIKQTYKPNQPQEKKKLKLELAHKIALISAGIALLVLLFGNNILGRFGFYNEPKVKPDSTLIVKTKADTTLLNQELPYLENVPIIDKGLFIKYSFNDFIIGGANIDTISINARAKSGESLYINKEKMEVQIDITKEPFIDFEYKGSFYSIEINGHHPIINCILKQNTTPTLKLKKYENL